MRYGYRRLTVLLRRAGWPVNARRMYRLYTEECLAVRTKQRKKLASRTRLPLPQATRPNRRWSMDFVAARLVDGRLFRIFTVVDQFTRECVALVADQRLSGAKVVAALNQALAERGTAPGSITQDNGSEFAGKDLDARAVAHNVKLDFIRPGRPVENGSAESCNGRLRDECLHVELFFSLTDASRKLACWQADYSQHRPHHSLTARTPSEFAALHRPANHTTAGEGHCALAPTRTPPPGRGQGSAQPARAALDPAPAAAKDQPVLGRSTPPAQVRNLQSLGESLERRKGPPNGP